ncbi:MAG: hypothetical protein ABH954_03550 [Candidatus Omnitrophota bacterium]
MNCEKIKDLILTDFSDGRLNEKLQKHISEHLNSCKNCQEFAQAVQKMTIEPFKKAKRTLAPEYLWQRIKDKISAQEPKPAFTGLLDNLRVIFHSKPALALATIAAVIIIAAILFRQPINGNEVNIYLNEQIDFVSYLGENGNGNGSSALNLGTAIEEFLL